MASGPPGSMPAPLPAGEPPPPSSDPSWEGDRMFVATYLIPLDQLNLNSLAADPGSTSTFMIIAISEASVTQLASC
jgi:hypothetical protein